MVFRIGISTGHAMVGNVGTSDLFNYTAIGDVVNLAQRLQAAANPGQILLYKGTYDFVADQVRATHSPRWWSKAARSRLKCTSSRG